MYRSFITCDDPKGVVDCGKIRKSKSNSQKMEPKIESQRKLWKSSSSSQKMTSKAITEEVHNPSSFQRLEVSTEAQKLNQMIEFWSKGMSFNGKSNDIAKDLLKGALDLQDSLVMLSKLQEASHYMVQAKKEQMHKSETGKRYESIIANPDSSRFKDKYLATEYQKPRLVADGFSRNCTEELKNVIRENLIEQNLFSGNESAYFHQRTSAFETFSASSSKSSSVNVTVDPNIPSKCPNLIAKLMGLEEYPSRPLQITPQKQFEGKKITSQQRPVFEIDMPKVRKTKSLVRKTNPESNLKDILETMQFKGLLKSNSAKSLQHYSPHHSKERLVSGNPPIVLIRPLYAPCQESKEFSTPVFQFQQDKALYKNKLLKKVQVKEELHPKTMSHREVALKSDKIVRKQEAKESSIKELKEEVSKDQRAVVIKEKYPNKSRPPHNSAYHKPRANEAIYKRADEIHKFSTANRKLLEKHTVKAKNIAKSRDQARMSYHKASKPASRENVKKNQVSRPASSKPGTITNQAAQSAKSSNCIGQKKNCMKKEKPHKVPRAKSDTENFLHEVDDKKLNLTIESGCPSRRIKANLECRPSKEKNADTSRFQSRDNSNDSQSSVFDAMPLNFETDSKRTEEASDCFKSSSNTDVKTFKNGEDLKILLLSSPYFLHHAEEVFDIDRDSSDISQTYHVDDFVTSSMRLNVDCAKELIEHKSSENSQAVQSLLLMYSGNARPCVSLEKLVDENKLDGQNPLGDSVYAMLEREMFCRGVLNGIWDSGWRCGLSIHEAEQVVNDIEKQVLSGLIEEVIA